RTLEQRLLHVLGRAGIDPIFDRLHRFADRRRWILLLEAMPANIPHDDGLADWNTVINELKAAVTGARVVDARLVLVVRQLDERRMLSQRHGVARGRDAGN